MNLVTKMLFKKHIEERNKLVAENEELNRKYELERRKSAYWILKQYAEPLLLSVLKRTLNI